jgi:hypothetical protein
MVPHRRLDGAAEKRPHAGAHPVTAAAGTAWAFTGVRTSTTPSAGREGGAVLARGIGLELPDAAAAASRRPRRDESP